MRVVVLNQRHFSATLSFMVSWHTLRLSCEKCKEICHKTVRVFLQRYQEQNGFYPIVLFDVLAPLILLLLQAKGTAKSCFLLSQLDEFQNGEAEKGITIEHIQGASASLYAAGTETVCQSSVLTMIISLMANLQTSSTLTIFILTMFLHPECQRKAQEEIDAVVGPGLLPDFSDRDSLPYLECILHETHRFVSVFHREVQTIQTDQFL